jgi:hypothetical protein
MTNSFSSSISFNGEKKSFRLFDKKILGLAQDANPGGTSILGALVTDEEYLILNPNATAYMALRNPGVRPELTIANPTQAQLGIYLNNIKIWEFDLEKFIKQEEAMAKFKANYIECLDETSRGLIEDPLHGTMVITIRQIRNILKLHFGTLIPGDMTKLYEDAIAPYTPGTDMLSFLTSRNLLFAELAAFGEVFSPQTRIRFLIASVRGMFEDVVIFWENTNLSIASQVENASSLSTALVTAYVKSKNLTTGARANSAITTTPVMSMETIEKRIAAGIVAGIAAAAKEATSDANCATCKVKVTGKNKSGRPLKYCAKCFAKFKADQAVS